MLKKIYINSSRILAKVFETIGLVGLLKSIDSKPTKYLASLFYIYDSQKMIELDLAWWNFKTMQKIEDFLRSRENPKVFEYGSGASTIWMAKRGADITSVEYDAEFFQQMQETASEFPKIKLILREAKKQAGNFPSGKKGFEGLDFEEYVKEIDNHDKFDLIIIDGRTRGMCLEQSISHLKEDGIILFDDTHRKRYFESTQACRLNAEHIISLTPTLPYPNQSSILRNRG